MFRYKNHLIVGRGKNIFWVKIPKFGDIIVAENAKKKIHQLLVAQSMLDMSPYGLATPSDFPSTSR